MTNPLRLPESWGVTVFRARLALLGCGLLIEVWALLGLQELPGADIPRHVVLALGAWAVYAAAIRIVLGLSGGDRRLDLALIFTLAVVIRATMLGAPPSLSDDVYRSVWDARLVHAGVNPYSYPPSAAELMPFRDEDIWPRVNHKDQRTPYPPLAELLGATAYWMLPERLLAMQGLGAVMDLASAALLAWLLHRTGGDPRRSVVIAWSPMGILHFAHGGHNDASMIALFLAAAVALTGGRRWLALAALGLSTAVKAIPILMVPAFARVAGPGPLLAWVVAVLAVSLPFLGAGLGLIAGIAAETDQRFNDSAHLLVERLAAMMVPSQSGTIAATLGALIVMVATWMTTVRGERTPVGAVVSSSWVIAAYLLVAPVVEPWYFTWLAPLVALRIEPGAGRAPFALNDAVAWLWLGGAAVLTDLTYLPGGSAFWVPIRLVEYAPVYALGAWLAWRWVRQRSASPTAVGEGR